MKGIGEPLQNNTKNKKGKVSITLDESVIKEIQELADSDNRKFSPYINLILIDWIQNHPRKEKIGAINSTYSLIWMKQKLCKFSDEEYAILETIKNSVPEVSTCMGAIRFLIKKYQLEKCGLYTDEYRTSLPDRMQLINSIKQQQKGFDSIKDQQVTNNYQ